MEFSGSIYSFFNFGAHRSKVVLQIKLSMRVVNPRLDKLGWAGPGRSGPKFLRAGPGRFLPIFREDFADIPPFF